MEGGREDTESHCAGHNCFFHMLIHTVEPLNRGHTKIVLHTEASFIHNTKVSAIYYGEAPLYITAKYYVQNTGISHHPASAVMAT